MTNLLTRANTRVRSAQAIGPLITVFLIWWGGFREAFALPRITTQPANQSVSLGANVTTFVFAAGLAPISYQWRFNDAEIASAVTRTLILTNAQLINAGGYSVVVTDTSGSVTSLVAVLDVDPTFTMITTGPVVTDTAPASTGAAWGDYDNDGFPDLLIGNQRERNGLPAPSFLYRNKGDGTFERVLTNVIGGLMDGSGAWADYDNDGLLDFYTVSAGDAGVHLYHNEGNGTFLRLTNVAAVGPIISDHNYSGGLAWGDYDNDGFVDMMVANGEGVSNDKNFLFRNQGNGSFSEIAAGSIVNDLRESWAVAWADYDDDGRLDLFVSNDNGEDNQLFHNDGPGGFTELTAAQVGSLVHDGGDSGACAWGDYDNDGHLDLFVASTPRNLLYHNNGNGTFTRITTGGIATNAAAIESNGCAWVDYDNDGYLDLFVVNAGDNNFLYHNNGDGTFTRIFTGSLVNDGTAITSVDCAWADYDNDGFMDVVVINNIGGKSSLFHNNGNTNHWINLKLVGTASNRAAIGAKVRLLATIGGKTFWQRRDIGGGGSLAGQADLRAGFGLGDATNIDTVRIEWPSGTVQELHNVASKQFLTVTEPARLKGSLNGGQYQLVLNGGIGFAYDLQASTNLVNWTSLTKVLTTNMTMPVITLDAAQMTQQYFRAMRQ
jgi:hypothetical protein